MTNYILDTVERIARYLSRNRVEPQIVQKRPKGLASRRDRSGNSHWQVYDPVSGSHCFFSSEQEVKAWLDTRYHHK